MSGKRSCSLSVLCECARVDFCSFSPWTRYEDLVQGQEFLHAYWRNTETWCQILHVSIGSRNSPTRTEQLIFSLSLRHLLSFLFSCTLCPRPFSHTANWIQNSLNSVRNDLSRLSRSPNGSLKIWILQARNPPGSFSVPKKLPCIETERSLRRHPCRCSTNEKLSTSKPGFDGITNKNNVFSQGRRWEKCLIHRVRLCNATRIKQFILLGLHSQNPYLLNCADTHG